MVGKDGKRERKKEWKSLGCLYYSVELWKTPLYITEHEAFATSGWQFYVYQLARRIQNHNVTIITHPDRSGRISLLAIPIPSSGNVTKRESEEKYSNSKIFWVNDQRDAQIPFYVFISIYNSLHVLSTQCSSSGATNYTNTASDNSHPENRLVI